ncbi:dephospho-CoA kinase [Parapedobacter pyrenivorans]|uniref:Dephospho-CoA kinase n=1 Tax=Parapedobacter pyrenivorans TaxID=1305674 RepID=A0A917HW40_9SPHI|nr:dephospho-CoA kinase [Parapedobacter pyrenivorans]GGG91557.1 dephospho-CoA kinase [Parapedobacter pyrenivorans]
MSIFSFESSNGFHHVEKDMHLKVGITGGIGSGKSIICRIFGTLGIPVFDADIAARQLMTGNVRLVAAIKSEFGREAYHEDGTLNRAFLAAQVFGHEQRLKKLNSLVHPVVIQAGEEWASSQDAPYTIKEAALLFESGSFKLNHYNVLVTAPKSVRIDRVMARDGVTAEQVEARMKQQWPDERKKELADFMLVNDGVRAIIPQVLELDRFFRSKQS